MLRSLAAWTLLGALACATQQGSFTDPSFRYSDDPQPVPPNQYDCQGSARTCPTGYRCAGTVCLPNGEESDTRKTGACSTDSDCPSGRCFAGLCQK